MLLLSNIRTPRLPRVPAAEEMLSKSILMKKKALVQKTESTQHPSRGLFCLAVLFEPKKAKQGVCKIVRPLTKIVRVQFPLKS